MNISEQSKNLYREVNEYYRFLISLVEEEEYPILQETGFEEFQKPYEEYINNMLADIPDEQTTLQQIETIISQFVEFQHEEYVEVVRNLKNKIKADKQKAKMQAFQIMIKKAKSFQDQQTQIEQDDGLITVRIQGKIIQVQTCKNPLITCLMSNLLVWFSLTLTGKPPEIVVDV